MGKNFNRFMDLMKLSNLDDEYDDEYEDEMYEDEEEEETSTKSFTRKNREKEDSYRSEVSQPSSIAEKRKASKGKLVSLNGGKNGEVHVIKPQEFNEGQEVSDLLRDGKTIVINMEGMEVHAAQRIIDFISGACYALDGTLQAISDKIFIAAPETIEVAGDLKDEILNNTLLSPELGKYRM